MPIQRIPRYILLIKDILANTPEDHFDHKALAKVDVKLKAIAEKINAAKPSAETHVRIFSPFLTLAFLSLSLGPCILLPSLTPELSLVPLSLSSSFLNQVPDVAVTAVVTEPSSTSLSFNDQFPTLRQSERIYSELPCLFKDSRGTMWLTQHYLCFASRQDKLFYKLTDISDVKVKGKSMKLAITSPTKERETLKFLEVPVLITPTLLFFFFFFVFFCFLFFFSSECLGR